MSNLWKRLQGLTQEDPLLVGTVQAHNPDGTSTLILLDGGVLRAAGQSVAVNGKAFVRAGRIEGEAPDLPQVDIEV